MTHGLYTVIHFEYVLKNNARYPVILTLFIFPNYFNETTMVDYRAWIKEPDRLLMWSLVDQIAVHPAPVGLVPSKVWMKGTWFLLSCVGIWILQLWCHLLVSFCTSSLYTLYYLGWRGHSSRQLFCWITLTGK